MQTTLQSLHLGDKINMSLDGFHPLGRKRDYVTKSASLGSVCSQGLKGIL